MNSRNENQHYISRSLLSRLKLPGKPFECYQIATGNWKQRSVDNVCAAEGYTQLLISGDVDNELETAFSKVESELRTTLKHLEQAASSPETKLPLSVYENMCRYHACLKLLSPAAKASAVVNLILQLNLEIEIGQRRLLRELNIPEAIISAWKRECSAGHKIVIDCPNMLQVVFRHQFSRLYGDELSLFRSSKWIICKSPIELPMSDIGLVPVSLTETKANCHLLPIAPRLLLISLFFFDLAKNSVARPIKSLTLTDEEARYWFDAICASANVEIICGRRLPEVAESVHRATENGFSFNRIVDMQNTRSAGLQEIGESLRFRVVSIKEYVKFVHSYIKPSWTKSKSVGI